MFDELERNFAENPDKLSTIDRAIATAEIMACEIVSDIKDLSHTKSFLVRAVKENYVFWRGTYYNSETVDNLPVETVDNLYRKWLNTVADMAYSDYLLTEHWRTFRQRAVDNSGGRCQLCRSMKALQIHHNNYKNLGRETFDDVVILCDRCHEKQSRRYA